MRAGARRGRHRTRDSSDGAAELARTPGDGHRSRANASLDYDCCCGECSHYPRPSNEAMARRRCARWHLADHEAQVGHPLKQFTVTHRVHAVYAVRHDRDRAATTRQGRSMGSALDAVRTAGHDKPFSVGEVRGKLLGHMVAVRGRSPRARDRDQIAERSREERGRPTSPQEVRPSVAKIVERGSLLLVAGSQRADTGALGCDDVLLKCPRV